MSNSFTYFGGLKKGFVPVTPNMVEEAQRLRIAQRTYLDYLGKMYDKYVKGKPNAKKLSLEKLKECVELGSKHAKCALLKFKPGTKEETEEWKKLREYFLLLQPPQKSAPQQERYTRQQLQGGTNAAAKKYNNNPRRTELRTNVEYFKGPQNNFNMY